MTLKDDMEEFHDALEELAAMLVEALVDIAPYLVGGYLIIGIPIHVVTADGLGEAIAGALAIAGLSVIFLTIAELYDEGSE